MPAYFKRVGHIVAFLLLGSIGLANCSSADSAGMGATPGGAQDEALATEKIDNGFVPNPEDITVEGTLASHDLPLAGTTCNQPLCINSAYAVAPTLDYDNSAVFVQIGFSSGIDEATFVRDPLNLSVVVDRSGSMSGEKISAVRTALTKLIDQLDENDRLSIVLFDDQVDLLLPSTNVSDKAALRALVSDIYERGSTDLSAGLEAGFAEVEEYAGVSGVSDRVIVFTDALANTGDTDTEDFIGLASSAAEAGTGLTVFGVGTDLNQQLVLAVTKLRGGNYAYLADYERISTVFDQDFDYLVTPLAYNLKFNLVPATGFGVNRVYGFPSWNTSSSTVAIDVATVFLSRGHGAIVARLEPTGAWPSGSAPLANLSLTYEPADGSKSPEETFETVYDGNDPLGNDCLFYSQIAVRRTVAYVNAAVGMKQACTLYQSGSTSEAIALLDDTEQLLLGEASATEDTGLTTQARVVAKLRTNMQNGGNSSYYGDDNDVVDEGPVMACTLSAPRPFSNHAPTHGVALTAVLGAWLLRRRHNLKSLQKPSL